MEKSRKRIGTVLLGLLATLGASSPLRHHQPYTKALYFSRADPAGGSIVAVGIKPNGGLSNDTNVVSTGGTGLPSLAGPQGVDPVPNDPLSSQGSVVVSGNYLFTPNSGSNTVAMFEINPLDPLNLTMVGQPVSSNGVYPVSVAYSEKYHLLCALNGGPSNGVSCYHVDPVRGLIPDGLGLRSTGLNTSHPPIHEGPAPTASEVMFSPDSSRLIAVFKGAFEPSFATAPLFLYNVSDNGLVGNKFANSSIPELNFVFSASWNEQNSSLIYFTDAIYGGALTSLDYDTGALTVVNTLNNHTEFLGSCWSVYSRKHSTFYDIATLVPNFGAVNSNTGNLTRTYNINSTQGGIDAAISGNKLYFLVTATNQLGVLDVNSGNATYHSYFTPANQALWQGMAIYEGPVKKNIF